MKRLQIKNTTPNSGVGISAQAYRQKERFRDIIMTDYDNFDRMATEVERAMKKLPHNTTDIDILSVATMAITKARKDARHCRNIELLGSFFQETFSDEIEEDEDELDCSQFDFSLLDEK